MPISAQTLAEIQRKKSINKPLTNPTAESMKAYNSYKPPQAKPQVNTPKPAPPTPGGVSAPGSLPQQKQMGAIPQTQRIPGTTVGTGLGATGMAAATNYATPQITPKQITYGQNVPGAAMQAGSVPQQLAELGTQWNAATTKEARDAIHGQAMALGTANGGAYDPRTGTWNIPQAQPQPVAQASPVSQQAPQYFAPPPVSQQIPIQQPTIPVMDMGKIGQYVDGQLTAELTRQRSAADQAINAGKTTAQQQLAALQAQYGRVRQDVGEERALENSQNQSTLDPFNGRTSFQLGMLNRERGRTDREMEADLATRQGNVNQDLATLENTINGKYTALQQTQGAERERMMQSIKQDERAYESMLRGDLRQDYLANSQLRQADFGMSLDQFRTNRGVYENERDFGYQRDQDQIRNDAQFGGTYGGNKTADQAAREWGQRFDYGQATGQFGNGQKTLQARQQEWENNFKSGQFNWEKAQSTWENTFKTKSFEQDMKEAAASRGLQWASLSQRQKEHIADQAYRDKQFKLEQDKFEFDKTQPDDKPASINAKESIDLYNDLLDDFSSSALKSTAERQGVTPKSLARDILKQNKDFLTDNDYKAISEYINTLQ